MTLAERFIEFNNWPTSRKTVLLMAVALPMQGILSVVAWWIATPTGIVDVPMAAALGIAGIAILVAALLLSLIEVRAGREGRWTAYLLVFLFTCWVFVGVVLLGVWSTPIAGWFSALGVLIAMWFDVAIALFSLVLFVVIGLLVLGLTFSHVVPYAPAMVQRTLDAQTDPRWAAAILILFLGFTAYGFFLSLLVVATRKLQDERLREAHEKMEHSAQLIRRYVPSQLAERIISGQHTETTKPERTKLTIFFSDLVGFTEIAEELEPEDLLRVLNEYFSEMTAIAERYGGTVDELSGDAILIFFGAPNATNDKDHALRAVRMAMEMQQVMEGLNAKWRAAGITETLRVRVGINTGVVTVGNFGSPERMKYAALGKHINLAARLQTQCEPGKILLSPATWLLVNDEIPCAQHGEMQLKGIPKPVMTYELAIKP